MADKFYIDYPHHVSISNEFVLDPNLDNTCKMIILVARVIGEVQTGCNQLRKIVGVSKPTFYKAITCLVHNGYCKIHSGKHDLRFPNGTYRSQVYEFSMVQKFCFTPPDADLYSDVDINSKAYKDTQAVLEFLQKKWKKW